jgi:hypothetical protein
VAPLTVDHVTVTDDVLEPSDAVTVDGPGTVRQPVSGALAGPRFEPVAVLTV